MVRGRQLSLRRRLRFCGILLSQVMDDGIHLSACLLGISRCLPLLDGEYG